MDSTAATKFNLICDNQYKVHVNSIFTYLNVYGDIDVGMEVYDSMVN